MSSSYDHRMSLDQLLEQEMEERAREVQQIDVICEMPEGISGNNTSRFLRPKEDHEDIPSTPEHLGEVTDPSSDAGTIQSEKQVTKNIVVMGIGVVSAHCGFTALQSLQSSLFLETGLGLHSLSVVYGLAAFSCLFGPIVVHKLSPNWTILASFFIQGLYVSTFYFPSPYTLIPSAVFVGLSFGPMFCAHIIFLKQMVSKMSYLTHTIREKIEQRYLRLFYNFYNSTRFWGHLVAALVIRHSGGAAVFTRTIPGQNTFLSWSNNSIPHLDFCGELQCQNAIPVSSFGLSRMDGDHVSAFIVVVPSGLAEMFVYVFTVFSVIGIMVIVLLMDRVQYLAHQDPMERSLFTQTLRQVRLMLVDPHMRLALPMLLFTGIEQGFIYADFTRSYVSCSLGMESIGYTMMTLGAMNTLGFIVVHHFSKHFKRPIIMAACLVCQVGLLMVLRLWTPVADDVAVFYVVAGGWGLCHAIWESLSMSYMVNTYVDDWKAPFCTYYLLQWSGMAFAFSVSRFLCTEVKIYIVAAMLFIAIVPYTLLEFRFHHRVYVRERTAVL